MCDCASLSSVVEDTTAGIMLCKSVSTKTVLYQMVLTEHRTVTLFHNVWRCYFQGLFIFMNFPPFSHSNIISLSVKDKIRVILQYISGILPGF